MVNEEYAEAYQFLRFERDRVMKLLETIGNKISESMVKRLEQSRDASTALLEVMEISSALRDDWSASIRLLSEETGNQVWRRTLCRTGFTMIEGTVFGFKRYALAAAPLFEVSLTDADKAVLEERHPRLKDTGKTDSPFWPLDTKSNLLFAFQILAKCHRAEFKIEKGGQEWQDFGKAVVLRNRLMHPKSAGELTVSDDEIEAYLRTVTWFHRQTGQVLIICLKALLARQQEFKTAHQDDLNQMVQKLREPLEHLGRVKRTAGLLEELSRQSQDPTAGQKIATALADLGQLESLFMTQLQPKGKGPRDDATVNSNLAP